MIRNITVLAPAVAFVAAAGAAWYVAWCVVEDWRRRAEERSERAWRARWERMER